MYDPLGFKLDGKCSEKLWMAGFSGLHRCLTRFAVRLLLGPQLDPFLNHPILVNREKTMPKAYHVELKTEIMTAHFLGRTIPDLSESYEVPEETIKTWLKRLKQQPLVAHSLSAIRHHPEGIRAPTHQVSNRTPDGQQHPPGRSPGRG